MDYETLRDFQEYVGYGKNIAFVHFHKAIEIVYVESGLLKCTVGQKRYELKEGDLLIIPPIISHSLDYDNTAVSQINVIAPVFSDFYLKYLSSYDIVDPVLREASVVKDIVEHLRKINNETSQLLRNAIYQYSLVQYLENVEKKEITEKRDILLFYNILNYISDHYNEDITLEELSAKFNYSKCYFSDLFKKNIKTNFKTYINSLRIQKSLEYIGVNTVAEVAFMVGYKSPQAYYSNFYKYMKCTPGEYLAKIGKELDIKVINEESDM